MGLTIHYELRSRRRMNRAAVLKITEQLRAMAKELGAEEVGEAFAVGPDYTGAYHWPRKHQKFSDLVPPTEGWLCHVVPGDGSESVTLGLCRYKGLAGWRLRDFCKTQYAARHGWEHFLACHRMVVRLLRKAEELGLQVEVTDEGELWETGSEEQLRHKLGNYDRLVAGFTGVLKDALGGAAIVAPIVADARFERLEAEGRQQHEAVFAQAAEVTRHWLRTGAAHDFSAKEESPPYRTG